MEKRYAQLLAFYYVIDLMSFTKAASYLHCSKAHVSRQITDLERQVGTPLLQRNNRAIKMTFEGEALFEHARMIVQELQFVENTVSSLQSKAEGVLRITSPQGYADFVLARHLPQFLEQYPKISLEMVYTRDYLDLVKEKIDVAIRITHTPPLDRVAKRLGSDRMVICASKQYLEQHGEPKTPQQLHEHPCLVYSSQKSMGQWPFIDGDTPVAISVKAKLFTNSIQILLKATKNGFGIARLPQFAVDEFIKEGSLVPLLSKFYPADIPVYAIYAQSRIIPPKVQAFIKFLEEMHRNVL